MAQIKISNLTTYTGNPEDIRWFVINNSGNTETFKYSGYTSPLKYGSNNGNILSNNYSSTAAPNPYDIVIGGSGNTITAPNDGNFIFGGFDNAITTPNGGYGSAIISSYSSTLTNGGFGSIIAGGYDNTLSNINNWGGAIIGGENNSLNGARSGFMGGGNGNTIAQTYSFVIGGAANNANGAWSGIIGGSNNAITTSQRAVICGGIFNGITSGSFNFIGGGTGNKIQSSAGDDNSVVGGTTNIIQGNSTQNAIIGGTTNTINNLNRVVMLGTSGRTASDNKTTYTENHSSYGQTYNGYFDNGSGSTFTIDWNKGNSQKITITGGTAIDFVNVKSGGQYRLQVVNAGTNSITGATAAGFTILCENGVLPNITNNGVDLCILEGMGTDILVRHFAGFATP